MLLIRRWAVLLCGLEIQKEREGEGSLGLAGTVELGIPAVSVVALGGSWGLQTSTGLSSQPGWAGVFPAAGTTLS